VQIKSRKDSIALQEDLDKLSSWSDIWQLKFNAEKCKVMHIYHSGRTGALSSYQGRQDVDVVKT